MGGKTVKAKEYFTGKNEIPKYHRFLNPNVQKFCLLLQGYDATTVFKDGSFHCQLSIGDGLNINIHGAASNYFYCGNALNSQKFNFTQLLAKSSHAKVFVCEDNYLQFLNRNDLPQFDSISLPNILNWESLENRQLIFKFIEKHLKPNGVVYLNYMCLAGFSQLAPIQDIIQNYIQDTHQPTNVDAIREALNFAKKVFSARSESYADQLFIIKQIEETGQLELFKQNVINLDWHYFSFAQIANVLSDAHLDYAGSPDIISNINNVVFDQDSVAYLNSISSVVLKEQFKDYYCGNKYRYDIFARGLTKIDNNQIIERLEKLNFVLVVPLDKVLTSLGNNLTNYNNHQDAYQSILKILAEDNYQIKSFQYIQEQCSNLSTKYIVEIIESLFVFEVIYPCVEYIEESKVLKQTQQLNQFILGDESLNIPYLVSPVIGGAIAVSDINSRLLEAYTLFDIKTKFGLESYLIEYVDQEKDKASEDIINLYDADKVRLSILRCVEVFLKYYVKIYKVLKII